MPCCFRWSGTGSGRNVPWHRSPWVLTLHEAPSGSAHAAPNELGAQSAYGCSVQIGLEVPSAYGRWGSSEPGERREHGFWAPIEPEEPTEHGCWARVEP